MRVDIPQPVVDVVRLLETHGFEAFVVGGSLRDLLLGREPKDWDITTNARPEAIQKIFPESVYENTFGTVGIKVGRFLKTTPEDQATDLIEVTTYRTESNYTDQRHPDIVEFVETIEEDLGRRDFTVNALAAKLNQSISTSPDKASDAQLISCSLTLIDPFGGKDDLHQKIIRAVGNPTARFEEDALRILRAIRLVTELSSGDWKREKLDWTIEPSTWDALRNLSSRVGALSIERIRDEFSRIVTSSHPRQGIELLHEAHVLGYFLPELERGIGVTQNLHHIYTVWEHNLRALETCPSDKLAVRLAALFHDIGKPDTKRGEGYRATFYNHDHVGARITKRVLERLRYPKKIIDHASLLVDNHLFYYNVGEVTEASVRRLLRRVGPENMDDLMAVRIGDRLGSGVPKAKPYKLRHLEYMIDKVSRDAISVKMLKIDGKELMEKLKLKPGPKVGALLDCLLAEVIEDAKKNERDVLLDRAHKLMDNDLETLRSLAKERIEEKRLEDDQNIKDVHRVQ